MGKKCETKILPLDWSIEGNSQREFPNNDAQNFQHMPSLYSKQRIFRDEIDDAHRSCWKSMMHAKSMKTAEFCPFLPFLKVYGLLHIHISIK
jgi:hypothetical protein